MQKRLGTKSIGQYFSSCLLPYSGTVCTIFTVGKLSKQVVVSSLWLSHVVQVICIQVVMAPPLKSGKKHLRINQYDFKLSHQIKW